MDRNEHIIGAYFVGIIYCLLTLKITDLVTSIPPILLINIITIIGGILPDVLEPPTWPGHRGAWHWVGGIISILIILFLHPPKTEVNLLIILFMIGFASHMILDLISSYSE